MTDIMDNTMNDITNIVLNMTGTIRDKINLGDILDRRIEGMRVNNKQKQASRRRQAKDVRGIKASVCMDVFGVCNGLIMAVIYKKTRSIEDGVE